MARKRNGLVPIGEVFTGLDGPVKMLQPAPQAQHHGSGADRIVGAIRPGVRRGDAAYAAMT